MDAINAFASAYLNGDGQLNSFFPNQWDNEQALLERARYLSTRQYDREVLVQHIEQYMSRFGISTTAEKNLNLLRDNAVVVIGGQQAGVLMGPLYSLYKMISIIKLAKQDSEKLGIPVVPVFWIAGEDHDYREVNHIYLKNNETILKSLYPTVPKSKAMISDINMNAKETTAWIENVMASLGETVHTNQLLQWVQSAIEASETMTDFFAKLATDLFGDTGLLLVDSGQKEFRQLAEPFYRQFIQQHEEISHAVLNEQEKIKQLGFTPALEVSLRNTNLFYYDLQEKNRTLLEYDGLYYHGKNSNLSFSRDQIMDILSAEPASFSTNVVTRPLFQEKLFPVLKFVAGPGEIAYWAELNTAFAVVGEEMPPVVPRLTFTLIERQVESQMQALELSLADVLRAGCLQERDVAIAKLLNQDVLANYNVLKESLAANHQRWAESALTVDQSLLSMLEKNKQILEEQLAFMQQKIETTHGRLHHELAKKYNEVESSLHPMNGVQERVLNMLYFFNKYGHDWLDYLLESDFEYSVDHYLLRL